LKVTEHAPEAFTKFRDLDGVRTEDVLTAINPDFNLQAIETSMKENGGRGGEFVYFTHDRKFVIKAISTKEKDVLISDLLPTFTEHIDSTGNKSLIARIYGVFTITTRDKQRFHVMIVQNLAA
jgi:hypothetical protein